MKFKVLSLMAFVFSQNGCDLTANSAGAASGKSPEPVLQDRVRVKASLTPSQADAAESAKQHLGISGFSRAGLIEKLSSDAGDGYSVSDATAAVDSLDVDWNDQAARSAKYYLTEYGFSCQGLIEHLSSSTGERYTESEALYGAEQAGAC